MILLGSTGSIGTNTLAIAKKYNLSIETLVAGRNIDLLNKQIKEFSPKYVVVADKSLTSKVDFNNVTYGNEAILDVIEKSKSKLVVNALVGFNGLKPTLKTIELGKKLALANKESLVSAGKFIDTSNITPIDSEHFALWFLLQNTKKVNKMYITASGGAFRDWSIDKIANASLEDVLKHPNWSMGQKITIDSATMINKIFEILECYWLFRDKFQNKANIDAFIETKSIIHGLLEHIDGSTTAHFAVADMKLPIAYAVMNKIDEEILKPIDFIKLSKLEFREIAIDRYPIWEIKDLLLEKPTLGAVVNSANEVAIKLFLEKKICFGDISKTVLKAVKKFDSIELNSIDDIFELDLEIRSSSFF